MIFLLKRPVLTALCTLIFFAGAGGAYAAEKKAPSLEHITSLDDVVAKVDGYEITERRLSGAVNALMPMVSFHSSVSDKRYRALRNKALEDIIDSRLIYKKAGEEKKDLVSKKEYDKKLELLTKRLPPGKTLEEILKADNVTMDRFKKEMEFSIVVARMRKDRIAELKKEAEAAVTEEYMRDYYNKHTDKFVEPEKVHLRVIHLKVDPSGGVRAWNEARKKAVGIAKEIKGGADFAELAKKYSQGPNVPGGGDLGWSHKGSLLEEVDYAVSRMKPGDVSDPIVTIYGFNIVKLEGVAPERQKKFKELNLKRLRKELVKKEYKRLWEEWRKDLRKNAKVEYLKDL